MADTIVAPVSDRATSTTNSTRNGKLFALYAKLGTKRKTTVSADVDGVRHVHQFDGTPKDFTVNAIDKLTANGSKVSVKGELPDGTSIGSTARMETGKDALAALSELRSAIA